MAELILTEDEKAAKTWLDVPDAALGKVTRKLIMDMPDICRKDAEGKGVDKALWLVSCLNILVGVCHESNATSSKFELTGYTVHNKDCGDWRITVKRVDNRRGSNAGVHTPSEAR